MWSIAAAMYTMTYQYLTWHSSLISVVNIFLLFYSFFVFFFPLSSLVVGGVLKIYGLVHCNIGSTPSLKNDELDGIIIVGKNTTGTRVGGWKISLFVYRQGCANCSSVLGKTSCSSRAKVADYTKRF